MYRPAPHAAGQCSNTGTQRGEATRNLMNDISKGRRVSIGHAELYVEEHGEGEPLLLVAGLGDAIHTNQLSGEPGDCRHHRDHIDRAQARKRHGLR